MAIVTAIATDTVLSLCFAFLKDLDEAMPAYYASIKALDSLDKKAIQEMKSFSNPPQARATESCYRVPSTGHLFVTRNRNVYAG